MRLTTMPIKLLIKYVPSLSLSVFSTYLLPVHGAHTMMTIICEESEEEVWCGEMSTEENEGALLFEKLGKVDVHAMESPKSCPILSRKEIGEVKSVLQHILIDDHKLPRFLLSLMQVHWPPSLYDVLHYIYGSYDVMFVTKRRFPTYRKAYIAGIRIDHLRALDEAIMRDKGVVRAYLRHDAFRRAFSVLTHGVYEDDISWEVTPLDESKGLSLGHLKKLAPIQLWLECQCKGLPKGVQDYIFQYAFGEGFDEEYDRMCTVSDLLFQRFIFASALTFRGKKIPRLCIKRAKNILSILNIGCNVLPNTFCSRHSWVLGREHTRCTSHVYEVLSYVKRTSYLGLLQEGWEKEALLEIEACLDQYIPLICHSHYDEGDKGLRQYAYFLYLIGAYGACVLNNRPDLQRFIA